MLAVGPGIAVLFPLWLLGRVVYPLCGRHPPTPRRAAILFAGSLAALIADACLATRTGEIYESFTLGAVRLHDYMQDYVIAGLFALHLYAASGLAGTFPAFLARRARPIRWLGGATFSLYLFHLPLIHVVVALVPWPETSWITRTLVFLGVPLLALGLAELTERRKSAWRRALLWVLRTRVPSGTPAETPTQV
jgi:peptidoglycan/LPS O-acetylase OafA/YrhL